MSSENPQVEENAYSKSPSQIICSNCRDADLAAAFSPVQEAPETVVQRKSDHRIEWEWHETDTCDFCFFLTNKKTKALEDRNYMDSHLYVRWHTGDLDPQPKRLLSLGPDLTFGVYNKDGEDRNGLPEDFYVPKVIPLIDCYGRLAKCISDCTHAFPDKSDDLCSDNSDLPLLEPIRLIDCLTEQIQTAPNDCSFLTLSYVWGNSSASRRPSLWPRTIKDAIAVTSKLGHRYLWVDKYCINQEDETEMRRQIKQMDRIYYNADACLVAATGNHYDSGLAGVSIARHPPKIWIDGLSLAICKKNRMETGVMDSPWSYRGWTFQELMFSRKRIYFTDFEVLFECCHGTCGEAFSADEEMYSFSSISWPCPRIHDQIWSFIEDYTSRSLTYPSDILNAFQGVYHAMEPKDSLLGTRFYHVWGLPIFTLPNTTATSYFAIGLAWVPTNIDSEEGQERRVGFPSFSWTGWFGQVEFKPKDVCLSCRVWLEFGENGSLQMDLEEYCSVVRYQLLSPPLSPFIHIECLSIPVEVRWLQGEQRSTRVFVGPSRDYWHAFESMNTCALRSNLDTEFGQGAQRRLSLVAILLKVPDDDPYAYGPLYFLLHTGDHWERVGSFQINWILIKRCCLSRDTDHIEREYEDSPLRDWSGADQKADWRVWRETMSWERKKFRLG